MFIIDQEEATQHIEWLDKYTIIFNNQIFTRGFDIFPNAYQKAFEFCCQLSSDEDPPLYLILKHPYYLTVWIEQKEVTLVKGIFNSPINIYKPKSTASLSLKAARSKADTPNYIDGEESRNNNQLATPGLPDSLP